MFATTEEGEIFFVDHEPEPTEKIAKLRAETELLNLQAEKERKEISRLTRIEVAEIALAQRPSEKYWFIPKAASFWKPIAAGLTLAGAFFFLFQPIVERKSTLAGLDADIAQKRAEDQELENDRVSKELFAKETELTEVRKELGSESAAHAAQLLVAEAKRVTEVEKLQQQLKLDQRRSAVETDRLRQELKEAELGLAKAQDARKEATARTDRLREVCTPAVQNTLAAVTGVTGASVYAILNLERRIGCILGPTDISAISNFYQVLLDPSSTLSESVVARSQILSLSIDQFSGFPSAICQGQHVTGCMIGRHVSAIRQLRQTLESPTINLQNPIVDLNGWAVLEFDGTIAVSQIRLQPYLQQECATDIKDSQCRAAIMLSANFMRTSIAITQVIASIGSDDR